MEHDKAIEVSEHTVICLKSLNDSYIIDHPTYRAWEFQEAIRQTGSTEQKKWFIRGVECEILEENKSWRKGKIKLSLVFYPEESEADDIEKDDQDSSLDEIRQMVEE
jgi:KGK domain